MLWDLKLDALTEAFRGDLGDLVPATVKVRNRTDPPDDPMRNLHQLLADARRRFFQNGKRIGDLFRIHERLGIEFDQSLNAWLRTNKRLYGVAIPTAEDEKSRDTAYHEYRAAHHRDPPDWLVLQRYVGSR